MKTQTRLRNRQLLCILVSGFFSVMLGAYLKISSPYHETATTLIIGGMIFEAIAIVGFVLNNFTGIKKAAF